MPTTVSFFTLPAQKWSNSRCTWTNKRKHKQASNAIQYSIHIEAVPLTGEEAEKKEGKKQTEERYSGQTQNCSPCFETSVKCLQLCCVGLHYKGSKVYHWAVEQQCIKYLDRQWWYYWKFTC